MTKKMREAAASAREMGFLASANAMDLFAAKFTEHQTHPVCVEGRLMCSNNLKGLYVDKAYQGASKTNGGGNGKRML